MSHHLRRFFISPPEGHKVVLEGREFHHLKNVLRFEKNGLIECLDGQGHQYIGKIIGIKRNKAEIEIVKRQFFPPPQTKIRLIISLLKNKAMEMVVQKATELGVWEINICLTQYSVPCPKNISEKTRRWQEIAIQALKQSGCLYLPQIIFEPCPVKAGDIPQDTLKLMALGPREGQAKGEQSSQPILNVLNQKVSAMICLFIGPEGGLSPEEIKEMLGLGFIPVHLGSYVLRAETAAVAGLAIIQATLDAMKQSGGN